MVGLKRFDDYWENFLGVRNQSQIKDHLVQENICKYKKFFRREKTPLKLGTDFWDVTNLPPLKTISSRDSEFNRDPRGHTKYILVGFNILLYLKYLKLFPNKH